jgi:hypothetical protein
MLEEAAQYVKFLQLQIKVGNKKFHGSRMKIYITNNCYIYCKKGSSLTLFQIICAVVEL